MASGRAFGRQGVWSKSPSSPCRLQGTPSPSAVASPATSIRNSPFIQEHHFVNTTYYDIEGDSTTTPLLKAPQNHGGYLNPESTTRQCSSQLTVRRRFMRTIPSLSRHSAIPSSPLSYSTVDALDVGLLEYYVLRLCPLTNPTRHASSPFADLVIPFLVSGGHDSALLSVMAFSARHRSLVDPAYAPMALSLKGRALSALRDSLGLEHHLLIETLRDPQIPVATMFLCLDEIVDHCDHRWVIHLRACQDLLHRRKELVSLSETASEQNLVSLAEKFFAFQDALSRTACGNPSHFGLEYWQSLSQAAKDEGWMGWSPKLASILFRITDLGRVRSKITNETFKSQSATLEDELASFESEPREHDRLIRQSVSLYYYCLLQDASPTTPIVATLVQQILKALHNITMSTESVATGLAFPVFVAAVELDPLDDRETFVGVSGESMSGRRLVLETLQVMSGSCLFNVTRTGDVIRQIWAKRDLQAISDDGQSNNAHRAPIGITGLNDWDTCVSPYCTNISLA